MLGDIIAELQGAITGQRVLPGDHGLPPTVETSYQATGEMLGVTINDMGTYTGRMRADGTLYGEGSGVAMSAQGDSASWRGQGVGQISAGGTISWRGSLVFDSVSPAFAGLRGVAGVFEWESEPGVGGKVSGKIWAWK